MIASCTVYGHGNSRCPSVHRVECKSCYWEGISCFCWLIGSGHAAVSPDEDHLLVSNLVDGIDIYSLPSFAILRHIGQSLALNKIIQVGFFSNGYRLAYSGSESGRICIFDYTSGAIVAYVPHRKSSCKSSSATIMEGLFFPFPDLVQSVAVSAAVDFCYRISAQLWSYRY